MQHHWSWCPVPPGSFCRWWRQQLLPTVSHGTQLAPGSGSWELFSLLFWGWPSSLCTPAYSDNKNVDEKGFKCQCTWGEKLWKFPQKRGITSCEMYFKSTHRSIFWKPYATYSHACDRTHIWGVTQNTNVGVAHFVCAYVHSLFPSSVSEILHYTYAIFKFSIWLPLAKEKCIKFTINMFKKTWGLKHFYWQN